MVEQNYQTAELVKTAANAFLATKISFINAMYLDRFLTLKRTAFREPGSYFQRYATIRDDIAVAAANEVWESINLVNLRENIAPTRGRATLVLHKDSQHHMHRVLLRKI